MTLDMCKIRYNKYSKLINAYKSKTNLKIINRYKKWQKPVENAILPHSQHIANKKRRCFERKNKSSRR